MAAPARTSHWLRATASLFRATAGPVLAISAIVQVPLVLIVASVEDATPWLLGYPLVGLGGEGAILVITLAALAQRPVPSIAKALLSGAGAWFDLFSTLFFAQLMVLVLALPAGGVLLYAFREKSLAIGLCAIPLLAPAVMRFLSYAVALPVVMAKQAYGSGALAKSRAHMDGHRWPAFLAMCVVSIPWFVVSVVTGVLDGTLASVLSATPLASLAPAAPGAQLATLGTLLSAALALAVQAPYTLLSVVIHHDIIQEPS